MKRQSPKSAALIAATNERRKLVRATLVGSALISPKSGSKAITAVLDNVNKVGAIQMGEPLTLTQAIVSAQGLKPTAKSLVKILRQKAGTSDRDEIIVNIKDIEKRKAQDPFLEPNDIVAVSEDSTKVIIKGIMKTLQNTIPSFIYKIP